MTTISWSILVSSMSLWVTLHAMNPLRTSCNLMESSRRSMIMAMTFHITSTSPISRHSPPPLGRSTTVAHVQSGAISPMYNAICIISMEIIHLELSGFSSAFASASHIFNCSTYVTNAPLDWLGQMCLTSHSISSLYRTLYAISTGSISTVMGSPGGGTYWYMYVQSCVTAYRVTPNGVVMQSLESWYKLFIHAHTFLGRGGVAG